jgi:rhodanese-related sulfurtransferase
MKSMVKAQRAFRTRTRWETKEWSMSDAYISVEDLRSHLTADRPPTVIDVRGDDEYVAGHIPGAQHIPGDELASHLAAIPRDRPVVTY